MRVLLAEDSGPLRGIIRQMLAGLGLEDIAEAVDGQEAWEQLEEESFDLLLTDWNMPRMSGLELLQKVRAEDRFKGLPVVMLTTRNNREDIISALKAGVNNYVTKPCKSADLKEKIEKAILQQAQKELKQTAFERIVRGGRRYQPGQTGPYMVCYENPRDMEALEDAKDQNLQQYCDHVYEALERANATYPGLELGYAIEQETKEVLRRATDANQLVGLLMISARDESGISLVRRMRHAQESQAPMIVVCDSFLGLEQGKREAVASLGAEIVERGEMDVGTVLDLIKTHLIPPVEKGESGLKYMEVVKGSGDQPEAGSTVTVRVTGMLGDGEVFEDSSRRGRPQDFEVGKGQVVHGLEQGVCTMRVGGRSLFTLPPQLGYPFGDEDRGIPEQSDLVYAVELIDVSKKEEKDS